MSVKLPRLSETEFQAQVTALAALCGWTFFHPYDSRRSRKGWPDLVLMHAGRRELLFAELKAEDGRPSPAQLAWLEGLRACGQRAFLWTPGHWPEIERILTGQAKGGG